MIACLRFVSFVIVCVTSAATFVHARDSGVLGFKVGPSIRVRAEAVSQAVFRISVNANGEPTPKQSAFLDPDRLPAATSIEVQAGSRIKTDAGMLQFDLADGTYALRDGKGNPLIRFAPIATLSTDQRNLDLHIGWPSDRPFSVYGCGNGADGLLQHDVKPRVGNGVAVQPFFWAPAGFAAFVLSDDENAPPQCDGHVENGAITWNVSGTSADIYLIIAPTMLDASRELSSLTGRPPVPPRWTMGYLQSRWGWKNREDIENVRREFDARRLPVDAFIFDFEWYTAFADYAVRADGVDPFFDFGFNPNVFPQPADQIKQLHDADVKVVGIRKPRLGSKSLLNMIREKHWGFEKQPSSDRWDARGLNFANADLRAWYANQTEPLDRAGIDAWWNDEGEFNFANYLYWNLAEQQAQRAVDPNARMWTLNRAFQPGLARFGAAAWTGDIRASWDAFRKTPTTLLNWSLAGMPQCGCDIGGYSPTTTPELFVRWMEAGTFFPVMRAHGDHESIPKFPWLFGPEAESAMRDALELRYRLVPLFYSLAYASHETGAPIIRPLAAMYPNDPKCADLSSQWFVGDGMMIAPIMNPGTERTAYLPAGTWYKFSTGGTFRGGQTIRITAPLNKVPVYIRGGTILPLGPIATRTKHTTTGTLELRIYRGHDATFTLCEDDGATNAYLKGSVRKTTFTWSETKGELSWKRSGSYDGETFDKLSIVVIGEGKTMKIAHDLTDAGRVRVPE